MLYDWLLRKIEILPILLSNPRFNEVSCLGFISQRPVNLILMPNQTYIEVWRDFFKVKDLDNSIAQLAEQFYKLLKENPKIAKAEAMHLAQLKLMKDNPAVQPMKWAP